MQSAAVREPISAGGVPLESGDPAESLSEAADLLRRYSLHALARADSVALDPHKWLCSPIQAACVLVKNRHHLLETFAFKPPYYNFAESAAAGENYYELGVQNSRGFRALKVWLSLRHVGRAGYERMIADDIRLAEALHAHAAAHPLLEARTCHLSICTFRFVPEGLAQSPAEHRDYLNTLNTALLLELQQGGEAFLSNAVIDDDYLLRACVVNFRTTAAVMERVPTLVVDIGQRLDARMRPGG